MGQFLCAYAMCALGGKDSPSVADVKKVRAGWTRVPSAGQVMTAAGYEFTDEDNTKVEEFVEEMSGQNLYDKIEAGLDKLPKGGAGPAAAAPGAAAGGDAPKEEEKKESSSEEEDFGGAGMFDEDY